MSAEEPTGPNAVRLVLAVFYGTVLACVAVGLFIGFVKHSVVWGIGGGTAFAAIALLVNSLVMAAVKPKQM